MHDRVYKIVVGGMVRGYIYGFAPDHAEVRFDDSGGAVRLFGLVDKAKAWIEQHAAIINAGRIPV